MAEAKKPKSPPKPEKLRARTVRGVKSFRRAGMVFTSYWQYLPANISKAKLDAISNEKRLEVEAAG